MKRIRVPLSYPASRGFDGASQAACQGGSFAVESVAAFAWNGWQASSGISGNLGLEYAVLHVAKPYIPFLRYEKEYMELCFKYEFLFLKYEKLWFRYEKAAEDEECLELHIPAHRDHPFRLNVTACSGRS